MTLHDRLSRMVDAALPGTLVPVSSLRELLDHHQSETRDTDPGLSLEEVAERCAARGNRTKPVGTATVRKWIRTGLRGVRLKAFPWGMSYRVTEQALASFIFALQGGRDDAEDPTGTDVPVVPPRTMEDKIAAARARYSRAGTRGHRSREGRARRPETQTD
jgi:hypothetical protein